MTPESKSDILMPYSSFMIIHKTFSFKEEKNMKNLEIKNAFLPIALGSTIILSTITNTGCIKKMDCSIEEEHYHKYVSEEGFETYFDSEYEKKKGLFWTEETVSPRKELEVMDQFALIKTEDNLEALEDATKEDLPYTEYEYKYTKWKKRKIGDHTYRYPITKYDFTEDKEHSRLTGYVRDVEYKYQGYRVGESKRGKSIIIESELVDDLADIKEEYPYFKRSDYKQKVYSKKYKR